MVSQHCQSLNTHHDRIDSTRKEKFFRFEKDISGIKCHGVASTCKRAPPCVPEALRWYGLLIITAAPFSAPGSGPR